MDFEKIKKIIKENKKYCLIGILLIGIMFFYINAQKSEVDNSNLLPQSSQSSQSANKSAPSPNLSSNASTAPKTSASTKITCDISGAVKHGGVYTLKAGARLLDLIDAAGGLTEKAQIKAINRAQLLKDQDQIYIPHDGEKVDPVMPTGGQNSNTSTDNTNKEQIHLNSASVADLQKLSGIGQKRAEQIIQFRDANGGFNQIEDITKVSGIGDKTFEKFKDQLAL
ncbi:helix-hairpin-helix domain-containing protein [Lactobacillus sp. PV034]|uniref:helix-hairpin-helix domain-containing protein n=1 Tax=Lactobacillus sp. PV034 TaxID=2594495 RepID=UPI00223E9E36|nr:helix-hairpin-helix domain-containing protein [Lactobacillus sp. PV034]QNQ80581.1 ComEA family DNA-binding protein [Lactobacillus sp. PV034]